MIFIYSSDFTDWLEVSSLNSYKMVCTLPFKLLHNGCCNYYMTQFEYTFYQNSEI